MKDERREQEVGEGHAACASSLISHPSSFRYWPLGQLILARLREFWREPEAIFWVYGFPILLVVALGIAFRNKPAEKIAVDVQESPEAHKAAKKLQGQERFLVQVHDADACRLRLRTGQTELIVIPSPSGYDYWYQATRPESRVARIEVDDALQRADGRKDVAHVEDKDLEESGGRYIDFLIPGLLGMSLMGGGLWGIGYVTVDMRIRKLLKRFLATPMKKSQFLGAIMLSRLLFMVPEVVVLLVFARLAFGVENQGSWLAVLVLILLGAFTFAGVGLLVASRARTLETVSGLMNLVMLPMWVFSGIFFSSTRFPEPLQPFIRLLPLTPLINALRAIMLEGASLASQPTELVLLAAWGLITFFLALRWFRWT
ncbi:MAG: ABC transporter permease [Planctomycetes bacterium]|nr:ABC transporter permease [Planctomycetota bacterium]